MDKSMSLLEACLWYLLAALIGFLIGRQWPAPANPGPPAKIETPHLWFTIDPGNKREV